MDIGNRMGIIEFKDVDYSYDGTSLALNGLTLQVDEGSFVCVLGGNGSGKSTLARHIDALLVPDVGEVRVLGRLTSDGANLYDIRSNSGLVFQNPDDQIVTTVVEDDVAFGPENLSVPSAELPERVTFALAKVGMQGFKKRETSALSGGQKQRVAIAGALAMMPRILVFDEASAMLDPRGRKDLIRLCHQLNEMGITIVLITHYMDEAVEADKVIVLQDGMVAMEGNPYDVLTQARRLRELALEVPFVTHMSLALQDVGIPIGTCIDESALEAQLKGMLEEVHIEAVDTQETERTSSQPTEEGELIIALEGVSFSYASKQARKRAWRNSVGRQKTEQGGTKRGHSGHTTSSEAEHHGEVRDDGNCFANVPTQPAWGDEAGSTWAIRDVTFSIREGDFLGIAGHTGSGKSTLIQLMAGLVHPDAGEIFACGQSLASKQGMHEVRRLVGLVLQYPEHQLFAPTVFEDVAFGPRNLGLSPGKTEESVCDALRLVHLDPDEIGKKSPFELSGGQQRRVALAGVLAMKPSVLILDEPTVGLDPKAHRQFLELIAELHTANNLATVMVSHDMDDIAELCNRVLLLNKGSVLADGAPSVIFSDEEAVERIGLGVPHTVHLAHELGIGGLFQGIPTVDQLAARIGEAWMSAQAGDV